MNVPQLRFSGFEGEWEDFSLSELDDFTKGMALSKADITVEGDPCILYGELYTKYGPVINQVQSRANSNQNKRVLGTKNDVLIPSSGEIAIDIACASALETKNILIGGDLNIFRPKENVSGVFLSYQINGVRKFELSKLAQGASVVHLYSNSLKNLKVKIPNYEEQQKIANLLKSLDRKIEKQQEKIENLEQFKKGMMQKIFSQELRFKDEDGGEFPEWKETFFGEVVTNRSEKLNPKKETIILPCIELENIEQGSGQIIGNTGNSDQQSMKNKFDKGSVLFGKLRPYLKKFLYTKFDGLCSTEIWVLKAKYSGLTNRFIYFFVQGAEFLEAADKSIGSKMPRADWNSVSELPFKIPAIREQRKIVDYLKALENKIVKEKEKLTVLEEQKRGFMWGMFV